MLNKTIKYLRDYHHDDLADFIVKKLAQQSQPKSLNLTIANLKAKIEVAQFLHWTSTGHNFYSEHLLYQRIYQESYQELDPLLEKFLSLFPNFFDPKQVLELTQQLLPEQINTESLLQISESLLDNIKKLYQDLELSLGTDDFLMALADRQENHLYLIKQRLM